MKRMEMVIGIAFALLLTSCQSQTKTFSGPSVELDVKGAAVTVSAHVNNDGEIVLSGTYSQTLVYTEVLNVTWDVGFETTLNEAATRQNTLFILYKDDNGQIIQQEYAINQPFEINFSNEQWVRKIQNDGNGNIVVFVEYKVAQTDLVQAPASSNNSASNNVSSCPGAPAQRVAVNGKAYVCTQSDRLIVRDKAGKSSSEITRLYPGTEMTIVKGPVCRDGWSWWRIRTVDGIVGWVAEGGDNIDTYFICPVQ